MAKKDVYNTKSSGKDLTKIQEGRFPEKAFRIVTACDDDEPEVAGWNETGDAMVIRDKSALESKYLTTSFESFVRQLHMYGFKKVNDGRSGNGKGKKELIFRHDAFLKGRDELVDNIQTIKTEEKMKGSSYNSSNPIEKRMNDMEVKVNTLEKQMKDMGTKFEALLHVIAEMPMPTRSSGVNSNNKRMRQNGNESNMFGQFFGRRVSDSQGPEEVGSIPLNDISDVFDDKFEQRFKREDNNSLTDEQIDQIVLGINSDTADFSDNPSGFQSCSRRNSLIFMSGLALMGVIGAVAGFLIGASQDNSNNAPSPVNMPSPQDQDKRQFSPTYEPTLKPTSRLSNIFHEKEAPPT
mmetsp:Transcript_21681/g.30396  ORF Transcript_21681/g.30396 Transcript_21681/m.30396 type:complete len:351 (-) Transcript_21681:187-1239(-)|eukprot:CAMPEP_0184865444 /NCGR_PEP_ID=MMETSP0580-20130426/18136_1 /TAXON_ID=1118495 /ORGANISM="Dactyliosolen fragilissimus" /LENGTH=350 /DNA_ID=CAMNT_0027364657 /DNA_START=23 /DNA_END=1075 /DNA_ORIENTATION=-